MHSIYAHMDVYGRIHTRIYTHMRVLATVGTLLGASWTRLWRIRGALGRSWGALGYPLDASCQKAQMRYLFLNGLLRPLGSYGASRTPQNRAKKAMRFPSQFLARFLQFHHELDTTNRATFDDLFAKMRTLSVSKY